VLSIRVIPNSKKPEITKLSEDSYRIKIDAPAVDGKANARLLELLADYLGIRKSSLSIVKGIRNRDKVIKIL
jgi:uncharacterized protein